MIMIYVFWATSMVFYGLSYNAAALPGSIYVNNFINAIVELAGYVLTMFIMVYLGRRPITSSSIILASVTCLVCGILFSQDFDENIIIQQTARWTSFGGKTRLD